MNHKDYPRDAHPIDIAAWDTFAAAALHVVAPFATPDLTAAQRAAQAADELLEERRKRFGRPG